jgi:hypothetical protein
MKLQFTNGYRPRFDQISRIMQFLLTKEGQKKVSRQEIISALGIPDKQIENLTSMMTGFGLVRPRVSLLTNFGKAVIQSDPYFDKLETLWIIHYIVSSNPEWVVWYRIINSVLPVQDRFEVDQVSSQYFSDLAIHFSERTVSEKLPKEVGAVFAAYSRSELFHLGILEAEGTGNFKKSNPVEVPDLVFLFCLLYYRDKYSPGSSAINTEDACLAEYSPGRVLNLPEYQVRTILGNLHNAGLVRLEQLANLDQVRLSDSMTQESVLKRIYGGNDAN